QAAVGLHPGRLGLLSPLRRAHRRPARLRPALRALHDALPIFRKSPLMRYVFEGELRYIKGDASVTIKTLEQLLEILTNQFDIPISARLTAELQSSREGLAMSYENFKHRQSNIRDSLKFSRSEERRVGKE